MANNTFSIHFIVKKENLNKSGQAPIVAKIKLNGTKTEFSTNRMVEPHLWVAKKEQVKPLDASLKQLNEHLESFKTKVYTTYSKLILSDSDLTAEIFKAAFTGKKIERGVPTLIELTKEHNLDYERLVGIKYTAGGYKCYKTTLKYLIEFIPNRFGRNDIKLSEVNYKFCEAFFEWLTTRKNCKNNGAGKQIQRVKKLLNFSIRLGYVNSNPMSTFPLKFKLQERVALNERELNAIEELTLQRDTLKKVKDIFLFQCYTGLSYSDVCRLSQEHLVEGREGVLWIKMKRTKTNVSFSIPLLEPAMKLIKRYEGNRSNSKALLPVLSNQKMNENLKLIQELAGLSKNLTSHLARHTFATTITLTNGVPIETVSKMLGHTSLKTTQIYAKVVDTKIQEDMRVLAEKLSRIPT
jgi:site-specific recombinase XerD